MCQEGVMTSPEGGRKGKSDYWKGGVWEGRSALIEKWVTREKFGAREKSRHKLSV